MLGGRDECTEQTPRLTLVGFIAMVAGLVREHLGEGVVQIPHGAFRVMLERGSLPASEDTIAVEPVYDSPIHDVLDCVESLRIGNLLTCERGAITLEDIPLEESTVEDAKCELRTDAGVMLARQRQFLTEGGHAIGAYETYGTDRDRRRCGAIERVVRDKTEADDIASLLGGHLKGCVTEVVPNVNT